MDSISCPPGHPFDAGTHPDPNRPVQSSALLRLPTELFLKIIEDEPMGRQDLKSIALTSTRLYGLVRPVFYLANSCETFRQALKAADVGMMDRCEQAKAAPNTSWCTIEVGCLCRHTWHKLHRPVDIVLESLAHDRAPADNCYNALAWLLDRNYPAVGWPEDMVSLGRPEDIKFMTGMLPNLLQKESDRGKVEGTCRIIRLLKDRGLEMPYFLYLQAMWPMENIRTAEPVWDNPLCASIAGYGMDMAMRSHCPPSLLEVILESFERRARLLTAYSDPERCPEGMECCKRCVSWKYPLDMGWTQDSCLGRLLEGLHSDLLYPAHTGWAESYPGEVADIFEAKLDLLIRFGVVTEAERQVLSSVLGALREISAMTQATGGLDRHRDGVPCWEKLWMAVVPFATHPDLSQNAMSGPVTDDESEARHVPQRVHRFLLADQYHPWDQVYRRHAEKLLWEEWGEPDVRSHRELLKTQPAARWRLDRLPDKPAWHQTGLDEYLSWVDERVEARERGS